KTVKIEGRMKSPEYVATTTRSYRQQINVYYDKKKIPVTKETMDDLKLAFNREFTPGFFNNEENIVDPLTPSKRGIFLGKVRNGFLTLEDDLELFDGVSSVYRGKREGDFVKKIIIDGAGVPNAKQGQHVTLEIPGFGNGATVFLTAQHHGENLLGEQREIPFALTFSINKNKPIEINITTHNKTIPYPTTVIAQEAQRHPFSKEEVLQEMHKYTSSIFQIKKIDVTTDSSFIPKSVLTKFRNDLDQYLLDQLQPITVEKKALPELLFPKTTAEKSELHVRVFSIEAIKEAVKTQADIIYYDAFADDVREAQKIVSESKSKLYLHTPMVLTDSDCQKLKEILHLLNPAGIMVNNVGALNLGFRGDIILGYQMNIFNDQQLQFYNTRAVASIELNTQELTLFQNKKQLLYYAHGRPVVMTFKEQFRQHSLTDQKQYTFPLRKTKTTTEMLYSKPIGLLQHTPEILNVGITSFYLELERDVFNLITLYKELLAGKKVNVREYQGEVTIGNLTKGVM
ncbi:TPA: hypothetical protein HA241_02905, partial [Candidatus Woesearchaeota archaeon]|nr:hypothetical protein [Candidatus Woesearchaeota archaeon]